MGGREAALQKVKVPAIIMMSLAPLWMIYFVFDIVVRIYNLQSGAMLGIADPNAPGVKEGFMIGMYGTMVVDVLGLVLQAVVILGAYNLLMLKNRSLAYAANVISCIPCISACCVIGIPIGIWGLVTMNDAAVKPHFES